VAGEQESALRLRTDAEHEVPAVLELHLVSGGINCGYRSGLPQDDLTRQCRERVGKFAGLPGQTLGIARAAIDRAPAFDLGQHRRLVDGPHQRALLGRKLFHPQPA
jgi:hypothetical protein